MSDPSEYTIGWICALTTEYVAARSFLDEIHDYPESVPANDNNTYTLGRMGQHNIVMAFLPDGEYGLSSAAAVATDMVRTFMNVRIGLMVGIGGGAPSTSHDIRLGDVVVSSPSNGNSGIFQYDFGKSIQDQEFKTTGFLNQPPRAIRAAAVALRAEFEENGNNLAEAVTNILAKKPRLRRKYGRPPVETDRLFRSHVVLDSLVEEQGLEMLVSRPERTDDDDNPAVHYGLIASANQLMKDATIRDKLAASKGVLCFEMEAAGLMNHFPCLVIRGICDYSDSHKNKNWQGYAAMTAAAYAKALVCLIHGNRLENEKKLLEVISTALTQVQSVQVVQQDQVSKMQSHLDTQLFDKLSIAKGAAYDTHHNQHEPRCHPRTRVDVLREIQVWAKDTDDQRRIYWLSGMAGTGKSTISRTVAKAFDDNNFLGASFFFKRGETDRNKASLFFSTIARQLVRQRTDIQPCVLNAIKKTDNISSKGIKEQFEKLILDPLEDAQLTNARETEAAEIVKRARETNDPEFENLSENMKYRKAISQADELSESELKLVTPPTLILVIDALDECAVEEDIEVVIPLLSSLVKSKASGLKVFIASRPEVALRYEFHSIGDVHLEIRLHKVPNNVVFADIKTFFLGELTEIKHKWNTKHRNNPSRQLRTDWPGQKRLKYLAEKAVPLFIHAATVCRFIRDPFSSPEVRLSQLLRTEVNGLHDKMSIIYLPVLWQYKAEKPGPELNCVLERFRKVVGTVILLEQPLSVESISSFLNTDITDVDLILDPLRSVLDIPEKLGNPVKLFHLSFRDFLLSQSAEDFFINSEVTHQMIALECLDLLSNRQPLRYNICGLRPADSGNIEKKVVDAHLPPHIQYACLHLVSHLKQGKVGLGNLGALHQFICVHLLHWLEALFIMSEHNIRGIFNSLKGLIPRNFHPWSDQKDIRDSMEEMDFFIDKHSFKHPLQLYWLALGFVSPGRSRIRKMFIDNVPGYDLTIRTAHDSDLYSMIRTLELSIMPENRPRGKLSCVTISPDASLIACGYEHGVVQVWLASTGEPLHTILANEDSDECTVVSLTFSGDSSWIISATRVDFWIHKADTGVLEQTFPALDERTLHIDASRYDVQVLATAHENFTVAVWSTSQDKKPRLLSPHKRNELDRAVYGFVSLSQDYPPRRVATWFEGEDHMSIWNVDTGKLLFHCQRSADCLYGARIRSTIVTAVQPSQSSNVSQNDNVARPSLLSVD
ncbi:unnamed protein product, partial [Colletotrichum noveboracense]